jgi:hypothetical protein
MFTCPACYSNRRILGAGECVGADWQFAGNAEINEGAAGEPSAVGTTQCTWR